MIQHLHVSLGPVQSFVAQARRTRDLWGGSYLLSLLAAHAMRAVRLADARIIRPEVDDDPLLRWLECGSADLAPPRMGSLPNQFTVEVDAAADVTSIARAAEHAVREAWQRICDAVWQRHVARLAPLGDGTEAIWRRQTEQFWELVWVAGSPDDRHLLERRKLWRTHRLPEEAGDKCTVMPELQELSGHLRAHRRDAQDAFWSDLRQRLGELELRPRERLCAIALVKRLYARVPEAVGGALDVRHWPSTVDVAAVLWVRDALACAPAPAVAFADAVVAAAGEDVRTGGPSTLLPETREHRGVLRLGASWFNPGFVASPRATLRDDSRRPALLARLDELARSPGPDGQPLGAPPVYYALLLADGDRVGGLVGTLGGTAVARALAQFSRGVDAIVRGHHGVTIYAGGDDVLAVLPLATALACAQQLEHSYRRAFAVPAATLSAAVVFARMRSPLDGVLAEARRLLQDVAKAQNGRSSLAAAVYRGQAPAVQWTTTWYRATAEGVRSAERCVVEVADALAGKAPMISSSQIHDLRYALGLLCGDDANRPGHFATVPDDIPLAQLVRAELAQRREPLDPADAVRLTALVAELLRSARARDQLAPSPEPAPRQVGLDGLLLASFLANGGREGEHQR